MASIEAFVDTKAMLNEICDDLRQKLEAGVAECEEGAALSTQQQIIQVCDQIKMVLLEKNKRYGNSALQPKHIFSKLSASESIKQRLDDKISRVMNSDELRKNDTCDIIGYLILLCISQGWLDMSDQID